MENKSGMAAAYAGKAGTAGYKGRDRGSFLFIYRRLQKTKKQGKHGGLFPLHNNAAANSPFRFFLLPFCFHSFVYHTFLIYAFPYKSRKRASPLFYLLSAFV